MTEITGLYFLIICLCSYRLTRFITTDEIPIGYFIDWLEERLNRTDHPLLAFGLRCDWCVGVYISTILVLTLSSFFSIPLPALVIGAVSSAVGIISRISREP